MNKLLISSLLASSISVGAPTVNDNVPVNLEEVYSNASTTNMLRTIEEEAKEKQLEEERLLQEKLEEERLAEEAKLELTRMESVAFNPFNVTLKSHITEQELIDVLNNTTSGSGLVPYAKYFIEAEETYSINALFLCGLAAQESGWGRKAAGGGTNLTGYAVYTRYHSGTTFKGGVRENVLATAKLLSEEYANPEGRYYTYWEGYGEGRSIYEINQKYCKLQDQKTVDMNWSKSIAKIALNLEETYHKSVKGQV